MPKLKSKSKKRAKKAKLFNIEDYQKKFFPRDVPIPSHNLEAQYAKIREDRPTRVSSTHFEHPSHWIRIAA